MDDSTITKNRYHYRITADERVYADWRKYGSGPVQIKYADNCKKCKRHRKNLMKQRKRKYDVCKESSVTGQEADSMDPDSKLHYMTLPRDGKQHWEPRMTLTSPIEWETSPLVSPTSADNETSPLVSPTSAENDPTISSTSLPIKGKKGPDLICGNDGDLKASLQNDIPDVISNNGAEDETMSGSESKPEKITNEVECLIAPNNSEKVENTEQLCQDVVVNDDKFKTPKMTQKSRTQSEIYSKPRSKSRGSSTNSKGQRSKSLYTKSEKQKEENEHFIIVNVPENAFNSNLDARNHNTILSIADDTATVVSEGVKCRYCLTNDTLNNEPLISPCQCCGTSKFVHRKCLEKWLTLRNLESCEVCKTRYPTKWVHRPLCSLSFPSMKKHDVFLLFVTISFYITLIFQFLGAVYVSIMASALPPMVTIVTLIGLSLGLIWFLTGSIALTIILYTSDYWKAFRKANKRKVILLESLPAQTSTMPFPSDLSHAVAV